MWKKVTKLEKSLPTPLDKRCLLQVGSDQDRDLSDLYHESLAVVARHAVELLAELFSATKKAGSNSTAFL